MTCRQTRVYSDSEAEKIEIMRSGLYPSFFHCVTVGPQLVETRNVKNRSEEIGPVVSAANLAQALFTHGEHVTSSKKFTCLFQFAAGVDSWPRSGTEVSPLSCIVEKVLCTRELMPCTAPNAFLVDIIPCFTNAPYKASCKSGENRFHTDCKSLCSRANVVPHD